MCRAARRSEGFAFFVAAEAKTTFFQNPKTGKRSGMGHLSIFEDVTIQPADTGEVGGWEGGFQGKKEEII